MAKIREDYYVIFAIDPDGEEHMISGMGLLKNEVAPVIKAALEQGWQIAEITCHADVTDDFQNEIEFERWLPNEK